MHRHTDWEGCYSKIWEEKWRPVAYVSQSLKEAEERYTLLEKEASGLTWACERFRNFLTGKHLQLETDHESLLSLPGSQALNALPPQIQHFCVHVMCYSCSMSCAREVSTADTLSRAPVKKREMSAEKELFEDTNIYGDLIMENLPASTADLDELRVELQRDCACPRLMQLCAEG